MKLTIPAITIDGSTFRRTADDTPNLDYSLREINDNLTLTRDKVEAWFRLEPLAFDWRATSQQTQLIRQAALSWTGLRGRDYQLRVTQRPYPSAKWAMGYSERNQHPTNPGHFRKQVMAVQHAMRGSTLSENEVYVGVTVGDRRLVNRLTAATRGQGKALPRELAKLRESIDAVTAALSRAGLNGHPATEAETKWLQHRSVGVHLPEPLDMLAAPATVTEWDAAHFYENVDIDPCPGKAYVKITGHPARNGAEVTRYVAVVSLGRCGDVAVPERQVPWMAFAEQLPFPVEWSVRGEVLGGKAAGKHMNGRLKMVADQEQQLNAHRLPTPPELARVSKRAGEVADEMRHAADLRATRMHGHIRAAIAGTTPAELKDRVRAFQQHYEDIEFTVSWDALAQPALIREFALGEKVQVASHKRHQPVDYWAAAVPHLASTVGDRDGIYLGHTVGTSRRAVTWDPWRAMLEEEKSGVTPVDGAPGSGKSTLLAKLGVAAADAGVLTTMVDYKGMLARLGYLPRWNGRGRHIDALRAGRGGLSIYSSIPDPTRELLLDHERVDAAFAQDAGDDEVQTLINELLDQGVKEAALYRMQAAESTLLSLLPYTSRYQDGVDDAISAAVHYVGGSRKASLDEVITHMVGKKAKSDEFTRRLGLHLQRIAEYPQTELFFGEGDTERDVDDDVFVVITAPGLVLPDEKKPEAQWTPEERIAIPLRAAVLNYASRRMRSRRMNERKLFISDEAHEDRRFAVGRAFYDRLFRQSRSYRERCLIGTQKMRDLLDLAAEGLTSEAFSGRAESITDAAESLQMHHVPTGVGYEHDLMNLSTDRTQPHRDFLFTDSRGNTDVVRVDLRHDPELLDAIRVKRVGTEERERLILAKEAMA